MFVWKKIISKFRWHCISVWSFIHKIRLGPSVDIMALNSKLKRFQITIGKVFRVQWGLGKEDVATADVLASGTEAEMKAEKKRRDEPKPKTTTTVKTTVKTKPPAPPSTTAKRKTPASTTAAPPAKKTTTIKASKAVRTCFSMFTYC